MEPRRFLFFGMYKNLHSTPYMFFVWHVKLHSFILSNYVDSVQTAYKIQMWQNSKFWKIGQIFLNLLHFFSSVANAVFFSFFLFFFYNFLFLSLLWQKLWIVCYTFIIIFFLIFSSISSSFFLSLLWQRLWSVGFWI